jgi:hypothetical protein
MQFNKDYVGLGFRVDIAQEIAANIDGALRDLQN